MQAAEGAEYLAVAVVVGAQLDPVSLRDRESDLQDVDRVQPQPLAVQGGGRIDVLGPGVQIERRDDQARQLEFFGREGAALQLDTIGKLVDRVTPLAGYKPQAASHKLLEAWGLKHEALSYYSRASRRGKCAVPHFAGAQWVGSRHSFSSRLKDTG